MTNARTVRRGYGDGFLFTKRFYVHRVNVQKHETGMILDHIGAGLVQLPLVDVVLLPWLQTLAFQMEIARRTLLTPTKTQCKKGTTLPL